MQLEKEFGPCVKVGEGYGQHIEECSKIHLKREASQSELIFHVEYELPGEGHVRTLPHHTSLTLSKVQISES